LPQIGQLLSLAADSQNPEELQSTDIPCNYFYNNAWYNLANLEAELYVTDRSALINQYAAFSFCQHLSQSSDQIASGKLTSLN
jgi:hypothetical protein